ncbi:2-hydroxyacid dehydrogenase [Herbaspirillum sp. RV1423]|uniref:2-hydroxyacid dehydrogenase n=1 Tax=Herbaspirillum sp. RV1423 TaxID=1443993 RepID=UPI0004B0EBDE|nr:2-hydroxyacid dehydrogenase [Herbaspirillum sp. RV1423]
MTSTSSRPDILIAASLLPHLMQRLQDNFICHDLNALSEEALTAIAPSIRGIASKGETKVTRDFIARFPALEIISVFGVGYDGVDAVAARERGIEVTNTPDVLTDDVADFAMTLLLATARQIAHADRFARSGAWTKGPHALTAKVTGARLGIVGLGRIGKAIARRAAAFDMDIAYHNRSPQSDVGYRYVANLKTLASEVDFLVLSMPGGAGTRALINAEVLDALGPKGFLINVARGSVVDQDALIKALQEGRIAGAGLDVFANEPNIPESLTKLDNVTLTPHMASGTVVTRTAMADLAFDNLQAHFSGKPVLTPVPR